MRLLVMFIAPWLMHPLQATLEAPITHDLPQTRLPMHERQEHCDHLSDKNLQKPPTKIQHPNPQHTQAVSLTL